MKRGSPVGTALRLEGRFAQRFTGQEASRTAMARATCSGPSHRRSRPTPAGGVTFTPERASLQDQSLPGGPRPRATPGLSKKRSTTRRNGLALRARITHAVYRVTGVVRERP